MTARPETMAAFGETAEAVGSTRSRLKKVTAAAGWLRSLEGERLAIGARYLGGRAFPGWDGRSLGIGGATLVKIIDLLTGATGEQLNTAWRRFADAGDVVYDLYAHKAPEGGVDLLDVAQTLGEVAASTTPAKRVARMMELLPRCSAIEVKYIVKLITSELRIGLSEGLVEAAILEAFNAAAGDVERAHMLTGDLGETALLASRSALYEAAPRLFAPLRFMLANAVADADEVIKRLGNDVWVEDKYDGVRCQLHCDGQRITLYSRDLRDMTRQFPEVIQPHAIPAGTILDGEILAWKNQRVLPFAALQTRLGRVAPSPGVMGEVPVVYVAWDILMENYTSTLNQPLRDRRRRLERLELRTPFAIAHVESARDAADLDRLFTEVRARLNEGLMAKNPGSPYLPGRRGLHWLKLKRPLDTLDVVVVGAEWGHGRRHSVMSDVTFAVAGPGGDLLTVGKAYTGLTDAEIMEMTRLLEDLTKTTYGRYHVVTPQIVLEVAFDAVQQSERHNGGYALRFPRIVRWRRDKSLADIDGIEKVEALAQAQAQAFNQKIDQA